MTSKIEKVEEFIKKTAEVRAKGELYDEERSSISGRVRGFLRAIFGEKREADYLSYINSRRGSTFLMNLILISNVDLWLNSLKH